MTRQTVIAVQGGRTLVALEQSAPAPDPGPDPSPEAMRLFDPAPAPMPGQLDLGT